MCVEMWHGERIYDGFFELFDDVFQTADVFKCDGYLVWRNDLGRYSLLVLCQFQLLLRRPIRAKREIAVVFIVLALLACQYTVNLSGRFVGLSLGFRTRWRFGIEAGEKSLDYPIC